RGAGAVRRPAAVPAVLPARRRGNPSPGRGSRMVRNRAPAISNPVRWQPRRETGKLKAQLGDRLAVGHRTLTPRTQVRILVPQPLSSPPPANPPDARQGTARYSSTLTPSSCPTSSTSAPRFAKRPTV